MRANGARTVEKIPWPILMPLVLLSVIVRPSSEAEIDGRDERRELRQVVLLERPEPATRTAQEPRFRIHPGPGRPGAEVARGEVHGRARSTEALRGLRGQRVAEGQRTRPEALGVPDVPGTEPGASLVGGEPGRGRAHVLERLHVLVAVVVQGAADAGHVVPLLEARLEVHETVEADPLADRQRGRDRALVLRLSASEVHVGSDGRRAVLAVARRGPALAVVADHLRKDDAAVGIELRAHDAAVEPGTERVADAVLHAEVAAHDDAVLLVVDEQDLVVVVRQ